MKACQLFHYDDAIWFVNLVVQPYDSSFLLWYPARPILLALQAESCQGDQHKLKRGCWSILDKYYASLQDNLGAVDGCGSPLRFLICSYHTRMPKVYESCTSSYAHHTRAPRMKSSGSSLLCFHKQLRVFMVFVPLCQG